VSEPVRQMDSFAAPRDLVDGLGRKAMIAATIGVLASAAGIFLDFDQFVRSYLVAWLVAVGISLGCLAILMIDHLAGGRWGLIIRRTTEAAASMLPFLGLLMVPILLGLPSLYSWARPEVVAADPLIAQKTAYLNVPFFVGRAIGYFVIWSGFAWLLVSRSHKQDETGDELLAQRMRAIAAPGLGILALTATFASIDWIMSLDPHWFSSLFGIYFLGGVGVSGFAFVILIASMLARREPLKGLFTRLHFHDYGKFLLAFVMLWTYFAISQLLIIWMGNLPEEITWYIHRTEGGWEWVSIAIGLLHFALPFLILLSADIKKKARRLASVALLLIFMRWVDLYWQTAPTFHHHLTIHWLDLATLLGVGGVWLFLFLRQLGKHDLLPRNAPRLEEVLNGE
jgi:hypothetical protein